MEKKYEENINITPRRLEHSAGGGAYSIDAILGLGSRSRMVHSQSQNHNYQQHHHLLDHPAHIINNKAVCGDGNSSEIEDDEDVNVLNGDASPKSMHTDYRTGRLKQDTICLFAFNSY